MSKILIACGGTGGHLAPGIAIAETLQSQGHACILLISQKQVDSALVQKYPHLTFHRTPGRAFAGGIARSLGAVLGLCSGFMFSRKLLRQESPDLVLLFGGFLSVGLGLAAKLARVPVALHEANCHPGKAIRILKRVATRLYLPDGVRLKGVAPAKVKYYGYPVRQEIQHILKTEAAERLGIKVANKLLVIIGGSQGAQALNEWVLEHFKQLAELGVSVYGVTGLGKDTKTELSYDGPDGSPVMANFVPFSDQMGDVISAADLVISRAGAGSIAEIIRCRAPSIMIPYPYAADNHQQANALAHEKHGACVVVDQDHLDSLYSEVKELLFNDWMLSKFKSNLERLEKFDSASKIAEDLVELCREEETLLAV